MGGSGTSSDRVAERLARARASLEGLSVGDAFGQSFFLPGEFATPERMAGDLIPAPPWRHTDDTEMAVCLLEVLERHGRVDQDDLAATFARRYMNDPERGYGGSIRRLLVDLYTGQRWQDAAPRQFGGMGSMGNGSAMRVGPLGAYFADDIPTLLEQAALSADVTHFNPEARAGAIAVAAGAAFAWNHRGERSPRVVREFIDFVADHTPDSTTRAKIVQAADLPRSYAIETAVSVLGNGSQLTCPDTIPLCIWLAARHFGRYIDAMWHTTTAAGDIDTNCAIVGGIVCLSDPDPVPEKWVRARGRLRATPGLKSPQ